MAENGRESRVEDFPEVEVDFQVNCLRHDWFLIFISDFSLLSLVFLYWRLHNFHITLVSRRHFWATQVQSVAAVSLHLETI